jgi:hypothetical protein
MMIITGTVTVKDSSKFFYNNFNSRIKNSLMMAACLAIKTNSARCIIAFGNDCMCIAFDIRISRRMMMCHPGGDSFDAVAKQHRCGKERPVSY